MTCELPEILCPECERIFSVVWNNDGQGPPEFCPMCGEEIDYAENERDLS